MGISTTGAVPTKVINAGKLEMAAKETNAMFAKNTIAKASDAQEGAIHAMIMDSNNDGKVSSAERSAHAADVNAHRDTIDKNGDGKVTFEEELRYALDQGQVTRSEVNKLLAVDTNKDGVMSSAELKAYALRTQRASKQDAAAQAAQAAKKPV